MIRAEGVARALTIAGSDSGGGAGIQADLKTFAALGVYGSSAITAVTAQNTRGVSAIHEMPPAMVTAQIDAVLDDIGAGAIKTGMLSAASIIEAVAACLRRRRITNLVVDPVMVAKSGDRLLHPDAVESLRRELLPLALIVTPNLPEAVVLADLPILGDPDRFASAREARSHGAEGCCGPGDHDALNAKLVEAAQRIGAHGPAYVLIKGGHLPGEPVDYLWDGEQLTAFAGERLHTTSTHGTGCTLSAAIAAYLARGATVPDAVARAKHYLTEAIRHVQPIGSGHGPLHHMWRHAKEEQILPMPYVPLRTRR
jgi:hydroxymethylpyrimidine/phosphomethylpyrimidine kinase